MPTIVRRDQLVEGNSKLATSASGSLIVGPAIAGALVQIASAAFAVLIDAISYLVAAIFLWRIDAQESAPSPRESRSGIWREIGEGLRVIRDEPILRTLGISTGIAVLFENIQLVAVILYITRDLGLSAGVFGIIFASGGVGYLIGAVVANRLSAWLGLGRVIVGGLCLSSVSNGLVPLASGSTVFAVGVLLVAFSTGAAGGTIYDLNQVSLRQAVTPDRLLGRVAAASEWSFEARHLSVRCWRLAWRVARFRGALVVAAAGFPVAVLVVWFSPVRLLLVPPEEPGPGLRSYQ